MSAPSVLGLWLWAFIVGFAAYYLCRKYPWIALFVVPFSLLLPVLAFLADRNAPVDGCADAYTHHATAVLIVVLAAAGLGMVQGGFKPWSLHAIEVTRPQTEEDRRTHTGTPSEEESPSSNS